MNVAMRRPMTMEQFLAWEARQEQRYEFDSFQPVAMAGGTAPHAAIQANLIAALVVRLRGKPCRPLGSELKLRVAGRIRYPEAFVACAPITPGATVVDDPVVVFEVLSDGSAHDDLILKNAEYQATPSIQRYVVLQQTHPGALVFARSGEDWNASTVVGDGAILTLPEIGIAMPLAELYADVDFGGSAD